MSMIKSITLEEEMKKNPQLKLSDIQSLREWCEKQPHLPKIEDSFLAMFLHSNYYRMQPTKNTIENYYTTRTHVPEFFSNRDPLGGKELRQAFKIAVMYGAFLDVDPSRFVYNDNIKYFLMVCDVWFLTEGTNNGYIYFADASGLSFGHIARISPLGLKKYLYYIQEAAPIRLMGIHFINAPPAMELLMNMMKPFMKKEMIDMIHFHSSLKSASEYVPIDSLPNEVGGKAGSMYKLAEIEVKKLEDHREWFLMDEATGRVNEALRIDKNKSASDLFGIEGSFKKLDID
ncbi:alpha-tocopherol transfer protein-like isoform X2 [Polyergus mexicanus]|uniref:alpha-tocopherol transfer protein-like isoform X2 n=1 Tax=Polyergus mexicanus TaxID=615972 RepID=UPI0038B67250